MIHAGCSIRIPALFQPFDNLSTPSRQHTMVNEDFQKIEIISSFRQAKLAEETILQKASLCGYNGEAVFALELCLEEALTNAIRHGNTGIVSKKVTIRYRVSPHAIDVYIADEGRGFDPARVPDPTLSENLPRPSGRGILLMRSYMSHVEYNTPGNEVHMVLNRH
jgi:serine/threonine-protein kinase RsbW